MITYGIFQAHKINLHSSKETNHQRRNHKGNQKHFKVNRNENKAN